MNPILIFKNFLFTILVPGTFGVYVPMMIAGRIGAQAEGVGLFWLLGLALLAVGSLIYLVCLVEFATRGRGTPAPVDPPRVLIVTGLYRHVRNPMYLGVLCVVFGWAALTRSLALVLYAFALWGSFQLFITLYEEPTLQRLFGDAYRQYCAQVGRWLPRRAGNRPAGRSA